MARLTGILVGMHFHPPAKVLLEHLPAATPLRLTHDTENPYDANAVAVWVLPQAIPASQHHELDLKLAGMGTSTQELLALGDEIMLGHVGATGNKPLGKAQLVRSDLVGNLEFLSAGLNGEIELGFDGSGLILVTLDQKAVEVATP